MNCNITIIIIVTLQLYLCHTACSPLHCTVPLPSPPLFLPGRLYQNSSTYPFCPRPSLPLTDWTQPTHPRPNRQPASQAEPTQSQLPFSTRLGTTYFSKLPFYLEALQTIISKSSYTIPDLSIEETAKPLPRPNCTFLGAAALYISTTDSSTTHCPQGWPPRYFHIQGSIEHSSSLSAADLVSRSESTFGCGVLLNPPH